MVEIRKTADGNMIAEVRSDQHFIDCPVCRDAAVIACMRALVGGLEQAIGDEDEHFVPTSSVAADRVH